jgi:hypothetical protein
MGTHPRRREGRSQGRMNSRLGKRDVRLRGLVQWHRRVQRVTARFVVEAPLSLRAFRSRCGEFIRSGQSRREGRSQRRMNSRLGKRDVRLRGRVQWNRRVQRVTARFVVEAPRSLRGFPQSLRRMMLVASLIR